MPTRPTESAVPDGADCARCEELERELAAEKAARMSAQERCTELSEALSAAQAARATQATQPRMPVPGQRIRAVHFDVSAPDAGTTITDRGGMIRDSLGRVVTIDDNVTVPPGTFGTVHSIDDARTVHVAWDNGAKLGLLADRDQWELVEDTQNTTGEKNGDRDR